MKKCPKCKEMVSCRNWRYGTKMCSRCDGRFRIKLKNIVQKK